MRGVWKWWRKGKPVCVLEANVGSSLRAKHVAQSVCLVVS